MKRVHLAVYVTAEEAAALRKVAEGSRQANLSEWAREVLLRSIRWRPSPPSEPGKPSSSGS